MLRLFLASASSDRLHAAKEYLRAFPPATEVFVVAQERGAADDLVRSLAAESIATFGFHRFSLTQLALRLAAGKLAERGLTPVSTLAAQAAAAHVSYRLASDGALPYLEKVSNFPGFAPSLANTLRELRLAEISDADGDLGGLLGAYNEELKQYSFSDASVLFELAAESVELHVPLLLLDVRIESLRQRELIAALVNAAPDVFVTAHTADETTRRFFGDAEIVLAPQHSPKSSLERLRANLFSPESLAPATFDESVAFFSAPGEGREAVEIARAILDHARRGVRFDEMAIFLRSPAKYQAHLESAFDRAGIPAYFARGSRRPDPCGRALLALLACAAERLSARRFAEYLSLGQVPRDEKTDTWRAPEDFPTLFEEEEPDRKEPKNDRKEPWRWESLLIEAAVIGGKDRWQRRLRGLEAELERKLDEVISEEPESSRVEAVRAQITRLRQLADFALPIIARLEALKDCTSWRDWIDALRELAAATLRNPDRVLEVLTELEPMSDIAPVSIDEVRVTLSDRLSSLEVRPPKRRFGRVFVAPIEQAAGRAFKVVFVPGLAERAFPQRVREDPLLLDVERRELSNELETNEQRANNERLRLQFAISAASQAVYISYPRIDAAQGRSRVASFYALDVIRAVTGRIPDHKELERMTTGAASRLAWPAPDDAHAAIDDLEHDLAILGPRLALATKQDQAGRARYLLELNSFMAASLRARFGRWQLPNWNRFDGITKKNDALDAHSLKVRPYSASSLQRYAACPHQFFLSAILRLAPREDPEPPVRLDALTRGLMIHAMHAATLRRLKTLDLLPMTAERIEAAEKVLHEIVDEIAVKWEEELAPAIPRVWSDEVQLIRTDLRLWLREIAAETDQWIAEQCELAFGLRPSPDYDEASMRDPVKLPGGWLLHGAIDLIERRVVFGDLRVSDYKTGSNRTRDDLVINGGETLQPLLYALAVEELFPNSSVSVSRLFFSTSKGGFAKRDVDLNDRNRERILQVLVDIDEAITTGFLPPAPRNNKYKNACDWCDFVSVCGPHEVLRSTQRKKQEPLGQLKELRDVP